MDTGADIELRPTLKQRAMKRISGRNRTETSLRNIVAVVSIAMSLWSDGAFAQTSPRQDTDQLAAATEVVLNTAKWCADYRIGARGTPHDMTTDITRLRVAQGLIAPGFDPGARRDGLSLLMSYREELERLHPDPIAAAGFLATASAVPVTFGLVERLNAVLCVSTSRRLAQLVTSSAEAIREQMSK